MASWNMLKYVSCFFWACHFHLGIGGMFHSCRRRNDLTSMLDCLYPSKIWGKDLSAKGNSHSYGCNQLVQWYHHRLRTILETMSTTSQTRTAFIIETSQALGMEAWTCSFGTSSGLGQRSSWRRTQYCTELFIPDMFIKACTTVWQLYCMSYINWMYQTYHLGLHQSL